MAAPTRTTESTHPRVRTRGTIAVVVLVALGAACDEPGSRIPTLPGVPSLSAVEISGPSTMAPGQVAQFTANMRMSDGTVKAAAPAQIIRWRVGAAFAPILQVDTAGKVTALNRNGETTVSVDVRVGTTSRTATREVVVVPEGTYRIVGTVTEAGFPTLAVNAARVEVAGGTAFAITDMSGNYRLFGVPAGGVVRVSAAGYATIEETVALSSHSTKNFQLEVSGPRPTVSGPYTLAIDVVSPCPNGLAVANQHRRYDAEVSQNGPVVEVTLTEPRFRLNAAGRGNKFFGRALGGGVVFTLRSYVLGIFGFYYYYYIGPEGYPDVAERLGDNSILVIEGTASTSLSGNTLSGTLNGWLSNWDSRFPTTSFFLAGCSSPTHTFTLTPR